MSPTIRWSGAHILDATVTDVSSGTDEVVDVRGFTHLYVYPESGGSVKYSVVASLSASSHGPGAVTGAANEIIRIPVEGNFYLVEAITAACHAHPVYIGDVIRVQDEGSDVIINAKTLNFVGSGVTATDDGDGVAKIDMSAGSGGDVAVEDAGTPLTTAVEVLNFTGAGVTLTESPADEIEVNIAAGGWGAGSLKSSPVDDLNSDSITGHSDNDPLSTWINDGSHGNFTGSGSTRPTYKTSGPNGHAMVNFPSGTAHYVEIASGLSSFTRGAMLCAYRLTAFQSRNKVLFCHVYSTTPERTDAFVGREDGAGTADVVLAYWEGSWWQAANASALLNQWVVGGFVVHSTDEIEFIQWTSAGPMLWVPGQVTNNFDHTLVGGAFDAERLGASTVSSEYFVGDIARFVQWSGTVTSTELFDSALFLANWVGIV